MSKHHALIKNDPRWHAARAECFDRDGSACVECGATERLEADHIVRISDDMALAFDVDNLQTLCRLCHNEKERRYEENKLIRVEWINPAYKELESIITLRQW